MPGPPDPSPAPGPRTPLVYVHVPKAAGTSLKDVLARVYRGMPSLYFLPRSGELDRFAAMPPQARARCAVLAGHEPFGFHALFEGTGLDPVVITVLRDPAARVESLYRYIFREPDHPLHAAFTRDATTIAQVYASGRAVPFDNHQVRYLAGPAAHDKPFGSLTDDDLELAKRNLADGCTAFGIQERFDESLTWFSRALRWPEPPRAARLNTTPDTAPASRLSESERRLVREHNALDQALYDFARGLFDERAPG